jgi:nucleoside-diphosphate-sugar epimerase
VTIAVSGASGFVGAGIVQRLGCIGSPVTHVPRAYLQFSSIMKESPHDEILIHAKQAGELEFSLIGIDCVIHCAALVHVMSESAEGALAAYRDVHVEITRRLAEQAVASGVRRFVFLSSVKVNGESTDGLPRPFEARNDAKPRDPYGISKWEAEQALWEVSAKTGLEVVVVRPPLVYGPGVKGNLARLLKLVRSGVPLPLGAVKNRRSLIGLDNLVDLLIRCVDHPEAAGQTFLLSDGEDLSTPDLLRYMAAAMGRSARLFPVPVSLLRLAGSALGKRAEIDRLVGSLQIDSSHTRRVLGWTPPVSVQEGIRRMVQGA